MEWQPFCKDGVASLNVHLIYIALSGDIPRFHN